MRMNLLSYHYVMMGRKEEAVELVEKAALLDPLSPVILQTLGTMYMFAERFDDAIVQADKMLAIDPQMRISIESKGWVSV